MRKLSFAVIFLFMAALAVVQAGQSTQPSMADRFDVRDVMIPTRDGVRLNTKIFIPKNQSGALPIIMRRTPYGVQGAAAGFTMYLKALAEDGYIFAFQDIRGKFLSEGTFVMQRPARAPGDKTSIDEGTDTYDSIEWMIKNIPGNNGRVGLLGVSYDGWTAMMGALEPHPALKAISPQASPADMWLGDDFHHNGAFRLSYAFEYAVRMESGKETTNFAFDRYDTYDWYLSLGPLSNIDSKYLKGKIPTWNDYVAHPDYDEFWKRQTLIPHIHDVKVPTLNVAGWWDQEDFYGPIVIYNELEKHDSKHLNYLVVGPWNHGGWGRSSGDSLGAIPFGSKTGDYFRDDIQAKWFAWFLKDKGKLDLPEALTFEAGSNKWQRWDSWPPKTQVQEKKLFFGEGRMLSFEPPKATADDADSFVSDPAHPVPYRQRPIQATYFPGGSKWSTWLVEDQRFVDDRSDVLSWESPILNEDVTIAGEVVANLFASTTGSDVDWVVKLIDVLPENYPDRWDLAGFQLMVSNEVFRGRYLKGFEKPAPIKPGEITKYSFSLHTQNYTFKKGHRMMVQVQSSWFPIIDRNPQTFVKSIFEAKESDFVKATHKVYRSAKYPSNVAISVVK